MNISYKWLKDYIDFSETPEELSNILTDIGLEVEGLETFEEIKGGLKGFVVGKVLTCEKHPNADKLSVTTVTIGSGEPLPIVCGAPNVAAGQKVVVATVGTELFVEEKSFTIKKAKIRGEVSEGMICAEDEIGLGTSHDGIMVLDADAVPGTPAAEYFKIETDAMFEIGLTPNRIDAGSHVGVARDLAAFFSQTQEKKICKPGIDAFAPDNTDHGIPVSILDQDACKRFTGVTITDLKIAPSPKWLQLRLKAIGLNPINNVVDITNFVLHELGQPLHAYDLDKLEGPEIVVRKMPEGTTFVTLDEEERKLSSEDLMVCDKKNGACIAGVFGGIDSGVTETTKAIFLESAYFDPVHVRKTAKRHGLSTDSSFRFERGVDPDNTLFALKRAALMIKEIAGGVIASDVVDIYPEPIKPFDVTVKYKHIDRLIGKSLDRYLIKNILTSLDIVIIEETNDELKVEVAPYRVDVTREADVIEEILRIYGYNNVEISTKLLSSISHSSKPDNEKLVNQVSDFMASNGFNEIMSNSLTKTDYYKELVTYPSDKSVSLFNPLSSDLGVMRQTLLFNGLEAIAYNINRKNLNLKFFEYGACYELTKTDSNNNVLAPYNEEMRFSFFLSGMKEEQSWAAAETSTSFFQLKSYVESLLIKLGLDPEKLNVEPLDQKKDIFTDGLVYSKNKEALVEIGLVNQKLLKQFDIGQDVYFAEIRWKMVLKYLNQKVSFAPMPKFPEVRRDLALLINETITFKEIVGLAKAVDKKILKRINLFDFYKGKNIPQGKKSYGVSFFLQDETKTLTDKEIDRIMDKISKTLLKNLDAELR